MSTEHENDDIRATLATLLERADSNAATLKKLDYSINGNGTPGIKTRVDRIEQSLKFQKRVAAWIAVPVLGLIVAQVWHIVFPHEPMPTELHTK
jgi:hypothetical protein